MGDQNEIMWGSTPTPISICSDVSFSVSTVANRRTMGTKYFIPENTDKLPNLNAFNSAVDEGCLEDGIGAEF